VKKEEKKSIWAIGLKIDGINYGGAICAYN